MSANRTIRVVLSFGKVMELFRENMNDANWPSQFDFFWLLFKHYLFDNGKENMDSSLISLRMNGKEKLSKDFQEYYKKPMNQNKLQKIIENEVLPLLFDSALLIQNLGQLIDRASNISDELRWELIDYSVESDYDKAIYINRVLCCAIQAPFVALDDDSLILRNISSSVIGYLYGAEIPAPCKYFVGRTDELEVLHEKLLNHRKVFLCGIPGIGKSELVKKYAKDYRKEYTNIIYLQYSGDLKRMISRMEFARDKIGEDEQIRFRYHSRFLRSLYEDSLLVIDNFNVPETKDPFLYELLGYRCRILFTTRSRYEDFDTMELIELDKNALVELVGKFYKETKKEQNEITEIIKLLHRHTFVVELAARLLDKGILNPKALRLKLEKEKIAMDAEDRIRTRKDGKVQKATYYEHIRGLFALYNLMPEECEILRSLTLIPAKGINSKMFATWMNQNHMNIINDLVDMGFVYPDDEDNILIHPMIREVAVEELKPSVMRCATLLDSIQKISLNHVFDFAGNKNVFYVVEQILDTIENDNSKKYLRFLEDVYQYMDKYCYESGMHAVLNEMCEIISDPAVTTPKDRAVILDCAVALEHDLQKKIQLEQDAIGTLGEVTAENALLALNLNSNLAALYFDGGMKEDARLQMERALNILHKYGLEDCSDSVALNCNYASLLAEYGEPQRAYTLLKEQALRLQPIDNGQTLTLANVYEIMIRVCLILRDFEQAETHIKKAEKIFELKLGDEPTMLKQKRIELRQEMSKLKQMREAEIEQSGNVWDSVLI